MGKVKKKRKIDWSKRTAAGILCIGSFHVVSSTASGLRRMLDNKHLDDVGDGLTVKEKQFVLELSRDLSTNAETLRKLGWRFINSAESRNGRR